LIDHHDLPLYRISHPFSFYHKEGNSKIQAAYDASVQARSERVYEEAQIWTARLFQSLIQASSNIKSGAR
jgi:hypothetical protein